VRSGEHDPHDGVLDSRLGEILEGVNDAVQNSASTLACSKPSHQSHASRPFLYPLMLDVEFVEPVLSSSKPRCNKFRVIAAL
jgi:hypothetical protein